MPDDDGDLDGRDRRNGRRLVPVRAVRGRLPKYIPVLECERAPFFRARDESLEVDMFWDQFAKAGRRLISGIVSPRDNVRDVGAGDISANAKAVGPEANDSAPPTPYLPDFDSERNESSLHFSS